MTEPDAADIPDFTIVRPPHRFRIDGDVFEAPGRLAPFTLKTIATEIGQLGDLTRMTDVKSVITAIGVVGTIMESLMPGQQHGQHFKARLESQGRPERPGLDGEMLPADPGPIDLMAQAIPALYYLLECYGLRPTVPSSPSPAGSTDGPTSAPSDGTSSTDGALPAESGSETSTPETGST